MAVFLRSLSPPCWHRLSGPSECGIGHTTLLGKPAIANGMVRRFYRANGAVIRGGGGLPWNYTPSALILVRQSFIWSGSTCAARSWCARSSRAHSCCASLPTYHVRLIGMETCGGSHFLGRALREQ